MLGQRGASWKIGHITSIEVTIAVAAAATEATVAVDLVKVLVVVGEMAWIVTLEHAGEIFLIMPCAPQSILSAVF